jgi:hypothetical protein
LANIKKSSPPLMLKQNRHNAFEFFREFFIIFN